MMNTVEKLAQGNGGTFRKKQPEGIEIGEW
jgi:hypothetical protein